MNYNYWYYNPSYYNPPQNYYPRHNYYNSPKKALPPKEEYYRPCIIEEKYCDYFDLGDKAPDFTLQGIVNNEQKEVSLSDYLGKWVLLFFYGSDFTFV